MRLHRKFKDLKKLYIRSFEPHKNGIPHIHALLYIPHYAFDFAFSSFKDIFSAPQNLKQSKFLSQKQKINGEINGFQWSLNNPTAYVMKYIYKTFIDISKTDKLDYLSAWYVKYKVRRFLTSKNQVPLWIYRKLNAFKKDYYHLCKFVDDENALCEWDFQKKYFLFMNEKESLEYDNGKFTYNFCGRLVASYEKEVQEKIERVYNQICFKTKTYKDKMYKNPPQMKDYQLLNLVYDENFKYAYHKKIAYHLNLAIERGLIDLPKLDLNSVSEEDLIELGFKYVF